MIEDSELLRRYADDRSETAFAELVQRRLGLVYSVAFRQTRDPHRAQEVAQVVFTELARRAPELARHPVLVGWLYRAARFTAIDILRADQSRARRAQEAHAMQEILAPENSDAEWAQLRPLLDEALGDLPAPDRDAILLRYFDDRPWADIGDRLRLTENAARMRVERALDRLHAALARRGLRSTAAALGVALAHQAGYAVPAGLAATVTGAALAAGAVSGAVVGAGGVAAGASFMTLSKLQVGVAALVVAAGVGTAVMYRQTHYTPPPEIVSAAPTASLPSAPRPSTAASFVAPSAPSVVATPTPVPPPAAASAPAPRPASAASVSPTQIEQWLAAVNSPALLRAFASEARELTMGRYTELFAQLNLGPERTEAFAQLLDHRRQTPMDLAVANYRNGIDPRNDLAAFEASIRATRDNIEREIKTLLGDAAYQQYTDYNIEQNVRGTFTRMGRILDNTPDALAPEQTAQLRNLLRTETGGTLAPEKLQATRAFLSPPQVSALESALNRQRAIVRERIGELPLPPAPGEK